MFLDLFLLCCFCIVCLWLCSLFGFCLLLYLFVVFECYELFLVTHVQPALGTLAKKGPKM
jgi:hypothetical protein